MKKAILLFLLSIAMLRVAAQRSAEQDYQHTAERHGDSVIFPLTLVTLIPLYQWR